MEKDKEASMHRIKNCCVPNCFDQHSKRHRFPKSDEKLFNFWVEMIGNPLLNTKSVEQIYKTYYICDRHFVGEFKTSGHRGLLPKAYPTLFLPDVSNDNKENAPPSKKVKTSKECKYLSL